MAIRSLALGANIEPSFGQRLRASITTMIHAGTDVRIVDCLECRTTRTRTVGDQWVVTRGLVGTADSRAVAEAIGAKTFLDVSFGFDPEVGAVEMHFSVIRAHDSVVIWADTFRADETTPMLLRASDAPQKREDRLKDLEMLLEGRPFYGYVAGAGFMILPYDSDEGDISGVTFGYRIYERFGVDRRVLFGLDLMGFLNLERLSGAILSAGSWWVLFRPDLINPEVRLGAKAGGLIVGNQGNTAVLQVGTEVLLRYRFGLYAYVVFLPFPTMFNNSELKGVGMSTGISFNW